MRFVIRFMLLCLLPMVGWAQSSLPPCPRDVKAYWRDCFSTYTHPDGAKYDGQYKDDKWNGQGTYNLPDGRKYVGQYKNGKLDGQGIEYRADGTIVNSGQWAEWKIANSYALDKNRFPFDGVTRIATPAVDTDRAEKDVAAAVAGAHSGTNRIPDYSEPSKSASAAQSQLPPCPAFGLKHNCFGSSSIFALGDKYVGEWRDDKRNGQGTSTFPDGRRYVGEWRDDKRNGQGTFTDPNGQKYVGEWRDGNANGQGTSTEPSGEWYVGEWRDGKRNGRGTVVLPDGRRYVGEFANNAVNGQGIEYGANGTERRSGRWLSGSLVVGFALDLGQFPFNGQTQPAATADLGSRERTASEAEATRRRQQELEQKLAIEQDGERQAAASEAASLREKDLEQRLIAEAREREKQAVEVEAVRRRQQDLAAQLAALQSQAASRPPNQAAFIQNQRRVALVIGNAQYKVSPLDNPVNDATDVDQSLRQLGFQTTLIRNATLGQMREATRRFADQIQAADVALIYFAGHGIESNRRNYMIPVNADLKFEYELADQAYDAGNWLDMLESLKSSNAERVNIVILDACRNNSLVGSRNLGRGLGRMDAPSGTFLAYSTGPGKVAADGARGQRNSPFTRHLLTVMQQPGMPIEEAFKEVRRNVSRETSGAQVPWESTSLTGFFSFRQTR